MSEVKKRAEKDWTTLLMSDAYHDTGLKYCRSYLQMITTFDWSHQWTASCDDITITEFLEDANENQLKKFKGFRPEKQHQK